MLRRRSIRLRIVVLVLVPVVALIGLYAVALSLTLSNFLSLKQAANVRNQVANPAAFVQLQLSKERGLALRYLANPTYSRLLLLLGQEPATDAAIRGYLDAAAKADRAAGLGELRASQKWAAELSTLHALRDTVVSVGQSRASAAASYSALIAGADFVLTQAVLPVLRTSALIQANDILTMEESLQAVAEERDLFGADLAARSYPADDNRLVISLIVQHRELRSQATSSLDTPYQQFFTADIPASTTTALTRLENQILASPRAAMRVPIQAWTTVNNAYAAGFRKALYSSSNAIRQARSAQARGVLIQLILIGGLGLIAILGAIAIAIILSRALLQQLDDLRLSALDLASVRLPAVLARLRSGDEIDVGTETPHLDPGANEIGQLGRAFNIAAQAAVAAAVDEAEIRRGVNDVFRNLARRNQSLLTRQLELLDAMERRVHDPEELADLFRVDHLTTRMRRHAEGLLIVAGGSSGRVWREPVPIVDVMRAAVAEIEDYTRIRVTSRSSSSVAGHAVADIIHMLAEIVENATTFSPANTPVRIESDNVAKGLIVEIEDRGLGMTDEQMAEINSKLSDPPLLDLSGSEQLGLFIAGQLARRHDVKIAMRGSAYGGITAVVLIPAALVIDPGYDEPLTIVGLRELGGRPVPQLPAASLVDDNAASVESVAAPEHVSAAGYILDLEAATGSVTTTAAQIDTDEHAIVPYGPDEPVAGELVSAALVEGDATPAGDASAVDTSAVDASAVDTSAVDASAGGTSAGGTSAGDTPAEDAELASAGVSGTGADAESAALKGAGAWLVAAESATMRDPATDPDPSAGTSPHVVSPAPMLIFGPQADTPGAPTTAVEPAGRPAGDGATPLSPADDWAALLNSATQAAPATAATDQEPEAATGSGYVSHPVGWPARSGEDQVAGGSVGWPDLPAASSGWLNLGSGVSGETSAEPTPLPRRARSRADDGGNGSYRAKDDDSTADRASLPRRSPGAASLSFGQDLADTDSFGPVPSETSPVELEGLPVRVRQANLAPQLREQKSTPLPQQYVAAPDMPAEQSAGAETSPEAARSFMSALQRGWERGRSMAEQMTDEPDDEQP